MELQLEITQRRFTPGRALTETQLLSIWVTARASLAKGVEARRIVTVSHPAGVRLRRT